MPKTRSEILFEAFLAAHGIGFRPVPTVENVSGAYRPDFTVSMGAGQVYCEVKELAENPEFGIPPRGDFRVRGLTVGEHLRRLIKRSAEQIQHGAKAGIPSILIIYNKWILHNYSGQSATILRPRCMAHIRFLLTDQPEKLQGGSSAKINHSQII